MAKRDYREQKSKGWGATQGKRQHKGRPNVKSMEDGAGKTGKRVHIPSPKYKKITPNNWTEFVDYYDEE